MKLLKLKNILKKQFIVLILPLSILLTSSNSVFANTTKSEFTSENIEAFSDNFFNDNMKKYNIPGATVSVVKDGKLFFSKGYGYSDINSKTPVTPDTTLFRIASITKLFTATSVMQLVEKGSVNLDDDITKYLPGFNINNKFNKPVKVSELLGHTSGVDSSCVGDLSKEISSDSQSVTQALKPRRITVEGEPGKNIAYSNYGVALAGCIVENQTNTNCDAYIKENIFTPLEMNNTTFNINALNISKGYTNDSNNKLTESTVSGKFNLYPMGGISSTANDMAKFMIANLNNGQYNDKSIFNKETSNLMHTRHASFDSNLPGTCYGFYENYFEDYHTICHAGYSPDGTSSLLSLIPESNIGIFVSVNQGSNNSFTDDYTKNFLKEFLNPNSTSNLQSDSTDASLIDKVVGTYRFSDYSKTTLMKGDIFGSPLNLKISKNNNNSINICGVDEFTHEAFNINATQIQPLVFKKDDNTAYFIFKENSTGKITSMAETATSWHGTYEKISWYDETTFQIVLFSISFIVSFLEIIILLILSIRRLKKKIKIQRKKYAKVISTLNMLIPLCNVSFITISMFTWGERLRYGMPLDAKLILFLPIISTIATMTLLVLSFFQIKDKNEKLLIKVNTIISLIIGICFVLFYLYYNLLGFNY